MLKEGKRKRERERERKCDRRDCPPGWRWGQRWLKVAQKQRMRKVNTEDPSLPFSTNFTHGFAVSVQLFLIVD